MSDAPQNGGSSNEPPVNQDDIDTVKPDPNKKTSAPPVEHFLHIRILYEHEHQKKLADMMRLLLESKAFEDRLASVSAMGSFPDPVTRIEERNPQAFESSKIWMDIVIIMIDEFTDIQELVKAVDFRYSDHVQIIAHTEYPQEKLQAALIEHGVQSIAIGWEFDPLVDQITGLVREPHT